MLPELFLSRMRGMLGEEYTAFLESFHQERYQALRLNPLKIAENGECAAVLLGEKACAFDGAVRASDPFMLRKVPWAEDGYYYDKEVQPGKHPYHDAGVYYIQEPSAMAPVTLLEARPGEKILDLCAAPGGKSTQIAAAMKGRGILVSNEIHPARAKILSENIERMGIRNACVTNETPAHLAEVFPEYFDRILVDAPCSGEGMFRKNEEACQEWSPENVELCAQRQDEILDCAARMLRPGGRLVYSTCTFAPEEDEGSVSRFVTRHPEFHILPADKVKDCIRRGGSGAIMPREAEREKAERENGGTPQGTAKEIPERENVGMQREMSEREKTGSLREVQAREQEGADTDWDCAGGSMDGVPGWIADPVPHLKDTLRLWPQHIKGEGHYAAVLEKEGQVPEGFQSISAGGMEKGISGKELEEYFAFAEEALESEYFLTGEVQDCRVRECRRADREAGRITGKGADKSINKSAGKNTGKSAEKGMGHKYMKFGDHIYLIPENMPSVKGLKVLRPGLHMGTIKKKRFEPSHALALALSPGEAKHVWNLASADRIILDYLNGQTFAAQGEKGWYLICVDGFSIGWGKLAGGMMKNHYPRGLRIPL